MLAYNRFPGKSFVEALIYLPMALPPTVIGFYLIILMGPKGWVGSLWEKLTGGSLLFTFLGITIASIIYSIPFAVQPMKAAFSKIDRRLAGKRLCSGFVETRGIFPRDYSQLS